MNQTEETAKLVAFIRYHGIQAYVNDSGKIQALEVSIGPRMPNTPVAKPFQVTEKWVELPARLSVIREWLGY